MAESTDQRYPHVARWVKEHGWVEIGYNDFSRSFVRALDIGGMIWEGSAHERTLDAALQALDQALAEWMREQLGEG
jgi:hypothetical protein